MKNFTIFEVILENHSEGIARLEIHFAKIVNCNSEFAKIVGYTREELIGKPIDFIRSELSKILQSNENPDTKENELLLQNQELRRLEEKLHQYQVELETQNHALHQLEEAHNASKSKMQSIFDDSSESILFIDSEKTIQFFNEISSIRANVIFGKQIKVGSSIYDVILPDYKKTFDKYFSAALLGKRTLSDVSFMVNNHAYWFEFQYAPVSNNKKEINGVLLTARDINEKKIIETEIKKHLQELEILKQTKDKFFSIVANELRNPFYGIIGLTEILEIKLGEENKEDLELLYPIQMMHKSSKSAFSLLENLIHWAKTQTGEIKVQPKNIYLKTLLVQTIQRMNENASQKNIAIEVDVTDNEKIYADELLVNSVLRNLLTNAIKFTHQNGKIIVSAKSKEELVDISIVDTGIGIDPMNLEKIFRLDTNSSKLGTNKEKGTGLGLFLCKEFIEKQGGKIWAESVLGKGSTFTFSLPLGK